MSWLKSLLVAAVVVTLACGTSLAGTYNWNTGLDNGTYYWNNGANWGTGAGGAYPNAIGDTAIMNTYGLTLDLSGQTITLGTWDITAQGQWWTALTNVTDGTLNFQVASGSASLYLANNPWVGANGGNNSLISANVELSSALNITVNEFGQWGIDPNGWPTDANVLEITGQITGNNGITLTGPGSLWLTNSSNSFSGPLNIQDGTLIVSNWAAIPTNDAITLGGAGTIGRILTTGNDNSAVAPTSR